MLEVREGFAEDVPFVLEASVLEGNGSVSLSWGTREVGSPCEWRGGARLNNLVDFQKKFFNNVNVF